MRAATMRTLFYPGFISGLILTLSACYPNEVNHELDLKDIGHSTLLTQKDGVDNCKHCHGENLKGRSYLTVVGSKEEIGGCYECHGNLWSLEEHTQIVEGIRHSPGHISPESNCVACHGEALTGSGTLPQFARPSCTECHAEVWKPSVTHTVSFSGVNHAPGYTTPTTQCVSCHGDDLRGQDTAPSCYRCHGSKWEEGLESDE